MLDIVKRAARIGQRQIFRLPRVARGFTIQKRYRDFSMLPPSEYVLNLMLCEDLAPSSGCVVECGVWRGGMSAGIADVLPGRIHYLFDSFEGLPPPRGEVDGQEALAYSAAPGEVTHNNCRAEQSQADAVMRRSSAKEYHLVPGWFSETLKDFVPLEPIGVLRLDADWYDSTIECLTALFPHVMSDGLILIDDYYVWDGCARAVHDYLSQEKRVERIQNLRGVCYLVKNFTGLAQLRQSWR
jgi:O-methyltransferase